MEELTGDCPLWVDNASAIQVAKSDDVKPRSRHYALRYLRVKDEARRIHFCPTGPMKADGLTKISVSPAQRRLVFHHTTNAVDEEPEEEVEAYGSWAYCLLMLGDRGGMLE